MRAGLLPALDHRSAGDPRCRVAADAPARRRPPGWWRQHSGRRLRRCPPRASRLPSRSWGRTSSSRATGPRYGFRPTLRRAPCTSSGAETRRPGPWRRRCGRRRARWATSSEPASHDPGSGSSWAPRARRRCAVARTCSSAAKGTGSSAPRWIPRRSRAPARGARWPSPPTPRSSALRAASATCRASASRRPRNPGPSTSTPWGRTARLR